jgi:hypothetical protein
LRRHDRPGMAMPARQGDNHNATDPYVDIHTSPM